MSRAGLRTGDVVTFTGKPFDDGTVVRWPRRLGAEKLAHVAVRWGKGQLPVVEPTECLVLMRRAGQCVECNKQRVLVFNETWWTFRCSGRLSSGGRPDGALLNSARGLCPDCFRRFHVVKLALEAS